MPTINRSLQSLRILPRLFPASRQPDRSIETARLLAVFLLVSYHVIGADQNGGLQIGGLHPLRLFADFLADLRMPLFAAVAGYVYALKPVDPSRLGPFLSGKFRRLALPGAVAISTFMISSAVVGTRFVPVDHWWLNYIMPYVHFWFLQAILVIFVVVCSVDILTKGRFLWVFTLLACVVSLSGADLPFRLMSVNHAIYLLPYFLAGALACRQRHWLDANLPLVIAVGLILVIIGTWMNLHQFAQTQAFGTGRRDLQSLAFGMGASALCLMLLPRIQGRNLGAFGFTIYLYHVLATSGMRRFLEGLGIDNLPLNLLLGILAGMCLPVLLHLLMMRHWATAWLFLGQRRNPSRHKISQTVA